MRKSSIRRLLAENKRLKYELTSVVMAPLTIEAMAISTRIRQHESELSTYGFISDNLKNLSPMSDEQAEAFERVWRECPTKFELIPGLLKKREDDICKSITVPNVPYTHDLMVEFELKVEEYLSSNQLSEKERDFFLELPNSRKQMVLDNVITLGTLMYMIGIPDPHFTTVKSSDCNIHVRKHPFWNGLFNNIKHDHT